MAHVYKDLPDARLMEGTAAPVSRFRPRYRELTEFEKILHDQIKEKAAELEGLYSLILPGRYNSLALTELESSVMFAIKGLTA